jgi:hypothetical protein
MTTLNFPSNPELNQTYQFGSKRWVWNGTYWKAVPPIDEDIGAEDIVARTLATLALQP